MKILKRISVLVLRCLVVDAIYGKEWCCVSAPGQYSYRQLVEAGKGLEEETCQLDAVVWKAVCGDSLCWRYLG